MIASLAGTLELRNDPYIILEVNGVGYKVLASHHVLSRIQKIGQELKLFVYTHVREDSLDLFGFLEYEDLKLFEYLIGVSGIGPKTAIGVFSIGSRSEIISAIMSGDVDFFTAVPRLGRKNAQKLIIELKSKFKGTGDLDLSLQSEHDDVVQALKGLGFSAQEAGEAVRATQADGKTAEERIRIALKYLGK